MASPSDSPDWLQRRRRFDSILRLQAAVVSGDPTQPEVVQLLAEALHDPSVDVRETAAAALSEFGPEAGFALPHLIQAIQDENTVVRRRALRAVESIAVPEDLSEDLLATVIGATDDLEAGVALQAIATLSAFGKHAAPALPALLSALWTGDSRRRALAGVAMARIGAAAVPALVQTLSHPLSEVRAKAAQLLAKIGPDARDAEPALRRLLTDREESVRVAAEKALQSLTR